MLGNNITRKSILFVTSLAIIVALKSSSLETQGHTSSLAKEYQQTTEYRNDNLELIFHYPTDWKLKEWVAAEDSPYPDAAKHQIRLKGTEGEYLTISIFEKPESIEDWLQQKQPRDIHEGWLSTSQANALVSGKRAYMWQTPGGHDYPGISLAIEGNDHLYYIGFTAPEPGLAKIEALLESLLIGLLPGSTNLPSNVKAFREMLSSSTVVPQAQNCCGETDSSTNTYPCCSPGNCTWKSEQRRAGSNNFLFGGAGTGRDAYRWMSLARQYTNYGQGGNIPVVGATLVAIASYGEVGHVGTVTSINNDGSVVLTEQNCGSTCTRSHTYATDWLRTYLAGYIYNSSSPPSPTPKNIGTGETIVDDFNFSNTYNFLASGPGASVTWNSNERAWGTSSTGAYNNWMHYTTTRTSSSENLGRWSINILNGGLYEIQAYIPNNDKATANSARYKVNGVYSAAINQASNHGAWVKLNNPGRADGNWSLGTGVKSVELADTDAGSGGLSLAFDAIKIISASGGSTYDGYHDGVNCNNIFGWAWNSAQPNSAVNVNIFYDGNNLLASNVPANQFRSDLPGGGFHAFNYPTPAFLKNGQPHTIQVQIAGNNQDLNNTPKTFNFNCSSGGGVTPLTNNVPVSDAVNQNQQKSYKIAVPAGATQLTVQLSGSGDADMYVRYGSQPSLSSYDCRPYLNGSNETCTLSNPQSGDWFVMVNGYAPGTSSYTLRATYTTGGGGGTGTIQVSGTLNGSAWSGSVNYSLTGAAALSGSAVPAVGQNEPMGSYTITYNSGGPGGAVLSSITPAPTQTLLSGGTITFTLNFSSGGSGIPTITNGQILNDSVQQGQQKHYRIAVPSGATDLRIEITGTNDADLYMKFGSQASFTNYDCRPYLATSNETCVVATPAPGDYYIMIDGFGTGSSAYMLRATFAGGFAVSSGSAAVLNLPGIIARVRVGAAPEGLAISRDGRLIYVVNYRDGSVDIVDAESLIVISTIEVESGAAAIVLSPEEPKAYVTNELSDSVSVIDLQSRQTVARIPTGHRPHGLAISPDGRRLYVCNMGDNSLSIIDTATLGNVGDVAVGNNPFNAVVSRDGRWVWVANLGEADPGLGTLSLVDTGGLTEVASIAVGTRVRGLGVSADGSRLYYSLELNNQINVLDTASRQVIERLTAVGRPYALGLPLNGTTLWSADADMHTLTSYDTTNGQRLAQSDLGDGATPHAIAFAPDGRRVYTTNSSGNELIVIDTGTVPALRITDASISGKKLIVNGTGFDNGAKILIGDVQQKTANDENNPTMTLISKKAGKQIARGQTVVLMIRNSNRSLSNGFSFTRPQ